MAFIPMGSAIENVPARTDPGEKGIRFPSGSNESQITPGTVGFHIQPEEERHDRVATANRISNARLRRIQSAVCVSAYVAHGMPIGGLYNAGSGANNPTEEFTVEVVSVNGNEMTVKGSNPKRLTVGISTINPEWPAPDTPRLITQQVETCLPLPAMVEFLSPSVLAHKLRPWVRAVQPPASDDPDDVEYVLELSCSVSAARVAFDAAKPPADGKYYAKVHFWGVLMPRFANWQDDQEMQVEHVLLEDTTPGTSVELRRADGSLGRVLYPGAAPFSASYLKDGAWTLIANPEDRLSTVRSGASWLCSLDVEDLEPEEVEVSYWVEAVVPGVEDPAVTGVIPHSGTCLRSQQQPGGFEHDEGWRCTNTACEAFQSNLYEKTCWNPDADGFTLERGAGPGPPRADAQRSNNVSRMWSRRHITLVQGVPGVADHRNFSWELVDGPSLQELVGGLPDGLGYFLGRFAEREGRPPFFGVYQTFTNPSDDETDHRIVPGLFRRQDGVIGPAKDWFTPRANNRGGSTTDDFPLMGPPPSHVYNHTLGADGFPRRSRWDGETVEFLGEATASINGALDQEVRGLV